jgi:hypothetical protein
MIQDPMAGFKEFRRKRADKTKIDFSEIQSAKVPKFLRRQPVFQGGQPPPQALKGATSKGADLICIFS